ncbi:beta-glucanase (GH16 family) [Agromyces sp. 3263]|uniref:glycoside hydrolase family 16 protein n=1 Tax=Agromyces sp. 3263 TaxID=2817750 RepID=UPI002864AD76|nr:family 16 glycosylhydrolase [Agromyces sp. 3263]MDR6907453.1 beta-glucanase (GH16 family) [Agromyces sp. 3263]
MPRITVQAAGETAYLDYEPDAAALPYWGAPVWRDEFDGTVVDPAKWYVRDSDEFGSIPDKGVIERTMCTVSGGVLHMRSQWLAAPVGDRYVTSAYMDQGNGKPDIYSQRFGRWEIRAKMPTGKYTLGTLAGFWLRNDNSGEIDIVEAWGFGETPLASSSQKNGTSTTTFHSHTGTVPAGQVYQKAAWTLEDSLRAKGVTVSKAYEDFHTWAFEYTPTYAATFLDGYEVYRITPATHPWVWGAQFQTPLHVRLSLHMGPSATYYGYPDPNNKQLTQNVDFQVAHVRIWALPT